MKYSSFLILMFFFVVSCKKDDVPSKMNCGNPHTSYIASADLINCEYKSGTYWVYIDSVNMLTDSTRVTDFSQEMIHDMCETTFQAHSFKALTYPYKLTRYVVVSGGLFKDFDGSANSGMLIYDDPGLGNYLIDSVFIYNQYYYDVKRTEIANDETEGNKRSVYYINSDYGILKHEIYDNSTLISKKILKSKNIVR